MSNIGKFQLGKFQLPPIKGTDVFPEAMQAPPIVRASVQYRVDPDRPMRPEVLQDYAKNVMAEHSGALGHFVQSQRQNYNAGVVDVAKTTRSHPAYDVSYFNLQGKHEIVKILIKMNIGRSGEKPPPETDFMTLMVLHDGNQISAISMTDIDQGSITGSVYDTTCATSFWETNDLMAFVNQIRIGDDYSVIASDMSLANNLITVTERTVMIATDVFADSLLAVADVPGSDEYGDASVYPMNGSSNTIYLPQTYVTYDPDSNTVNAAPYEHELTDAVTASGEWLKTEDSDTLVIYYVNSFTQGETGAGVRKVEKVNTLSQATVTSQGTSTRFVSTPTGSDCGLVNTVSTVTDNFSNSNSFPVVTGATFDGISLGSVTISQETKTYSGSPLYITTYTINYSPIQVCGVHPLDGQIGGGKGDGEAVGPFSAGGGTAIISSGGGSAENGTIQTSGGSPEGYCDIMVSAFDWAAGGPWNISNESVDAAVAAIVAEWNAKCKTPYASISVSSTPAGVSSSGSTTTPVFSGSIGNANTISYPYAVNDKIYYELRLSGQDRKAVTPYNKSGESLQGFINLSNGDNILQGFVIFDDSGRTPYFFLNGADITNDLASACSTSPDQINAIFMDIPFSKVQQFD